MLALFLVAGAISLGFSEESPKNHAKTGIWGGPSESGVVGYGETAAFEGVVTAVPSLAFPEKPKEIALDQRGFGGLSLGGTTAEANSSGWGKSNGKLLIYIVRKGDTISGIAESFAVSGSDISTWNPGITSKNIRVGQEINILSQAEVALASEMKGGEEQIIEDGSGMPKLNNYFIKPAAGFNWGKLHNYNAVDIANSCGTKIIASAEGLVTAALSDGWNGGYGAYVMIEHPNGTKTRYAHLERVSVSLGDYIEKGGAIGTMGDTGESTGCHLHFEVVGAKNPFVRQSK